MAPNILPAAIAQSIEVTFPTPDRPMPRLYTSELVRNNYFVGARHVSSSSYRMFPDSGRNGQFMRDVNYFVLQPK